MHGINQWKQLLLLTKDAIDLNHKDFSKDLKETNVIDSFKKTYGLQIKKEPAFTGSFISFKRKTV